jgi:hypothetical protein
MKAIQRPRASWRAVRLGVLGVLSLVCAGLVYAGLASAAEGAFKLYPGAVKYTPPDTEQNRIFANNMRPNMTVTAYLSNDSFEKVAAFYRNLGKEYTTPKAPAGPALPNGQHIETVFLILDGAADLRTSKLWASVRHPFIGSVTVNGATPEYHDIRDVTEIIVTEKHDVPKEKKDAPKTKQAISVH